MVSISTTLLDIQSRCMVPCLCCLLFLFCSYRHLMCIALPFLRLKMQTTIMFNLTTDHRMYRLELDISGIVLTFRIYLLYSNKFSVEHLCHKKSYHVRIFVCWKNSLGYRSLHRGWRGHCSCTFCKRSYCGHY